MEREDLVGKIVSLCKRRGIIFPTSEIYGNFAGFFDYGNYGSLMKRNVEDSWIKHFVTGRDDVVLIDGATITHPLVWKASGHVDSFNDPLVECKKCHSRFRADQTQGACPNCGGKEFTTPKQFNLLFQTSIGAVEGDKSIAYLRGEIAQAMFVNFKNVLDTTRKRLPFGIASVGKAFRNEITPGNFIFRTLEFDLMEFEYFIRESEWEKWFGYWLKEQQDWLAELGLGKENLRLREHEAEERSHYSKRTVDIEYNTPFGWKEMFGLAYRTDYDIKNHMEKSGQDLQYTDPDSGEKLIPHVIEPTFGLTRLVLMILLESYQEEEVKGERRVYLKLHPKVAPYKAAVFPLLKNKPELVSAARKIYNDLRQDFMVAWDERGNVGKRYYAQDEIGTPWGITVDFQTLEDQTVTIRDRDTTKQERVKVADLKKIIAERVK